jgi:hypothetical protein
MAKTLSFVNIPINKLLQALNGHCLLIFNNRKLFSRVCSTPLLVTPNTALFTYHVTQGQGPYKDFIEPMMIALMNDYVDEPQKNSY